MNKEYLSDRKCEFVLKCDPYVIHTGTILFYDTGNICIHIDTVGNIYLFGTTRRLGENDEIFMPMSEFVYLKLLKKC